ncbi:hypothetical protein [Siminovitchia fordii]|nr:hypothetical protein [Siminovitchia fordii]
MRWPTGYKLYRLFMVMDIAFEIIATSLIPQQLAQHIKSDNRGALREE